MRIGLRSLALTHRRVASGVPTNIAGFPVLSALIDAGKVISAWVLPSGNPTQYLTKDGSNNVSQWAACGGTGPLSLAEATNMPVYDAAAFGGKGGLTFDGVSKKLTTTGPFPGAWPTQANANPWYFVGGVRQDIAGAVATNAAIVGYGSTNERLLSRTSTASVSRLRLVMNGAVLISGSAVVFDGAHVASGYFKAGANAQLWADATSEGTSSSGVNTLVQTTFALGCLANATQFWNGAMCCAAVLNNNLTGGDLANLQNEFTGRLS